MLYVLAIKAKYLKKIPDTFRTGYLANRIRHTTLPERLSRLMFLLRIAQDLQNLLAVLFFPENFEVKRLITVTPDDNMFRRGE